MAVIDDRDRFAQGRGGLGMSWVRHKAYNYWMGQASNCRQQGDEEGYARCVAAATAPRSRSDGPPIAIADSRRARPAWREGL
jgi:hypothetical protein